jgi:Rnl2 family RNA ligase
MAMVFMKYPELVRLDKRPEILAVKEVIATEKIHGTNFRLFFPAGMTSIDEIQYGGRNEELGTSGGSFYGGRPARWFKEQPAMLERMRETFASYAFSDVTVFGEAFGAGIQKGVKYVTDDAVLFRAFDIAVAESFLTYDLFVEVCDKAGLPRVPEIWRGDPTIQNLDALLEKVSAEAQKNGVTDEGNLSEGVVVRSNPLFRDVFGQWLIIKHKSEGFSEVAKKSPGKAASADVSAATTFAETFVVRGRIINALGRIRDSGKPVHDDMQDMPNLVSAMIADLQKECLAEWNEAIAAGVTDKQVRSEVTKTLGKVYRRFLIEEATGAK